MPRKGYRKISSGGHVKVKRMIACEFCNFSEVCNSSNKHMKTGHLCPRCENPSLRIFDSNTEFKRAQELKHLRDSDKIADLQFQPVYPLHADGGVYLYDYVADFSYYDIENSEHVIEDVKGESRGKPILTDVAKMKIAHFEAEYNTSVLITTR